MKEETESETCPTCGGQGHMYQIEASLGGDLLREPPAGTYSEKVTCPRCGGSGKIAKIIAAILVVTALLFYFI